MTEIALAGHRAILLPEKALWLPDEKALIVADVHWGKAGHFRKHGMAIPQQANDNNARRLAGLLQKTEAAQIIFAGDLFHSRHNQEVEGFRAWREGFPDVHFQLVVGNHDILEAGFYDACGMEVFPESLCLGSLCIMHDAPVQSDMFVVHGHIHPGIKIFGKGRQQIAVPCFARSATTLILPAFGDFTGCFYVDARDFCSVYAVAPEAVVRIK